MSKKRARRAGTAADNRRKHRPRPVPKWLKDSDRLDAIARGRCLMVLSVLSGERPVTEAIVQARISRGTYYQLEKRAVDAMLAALNPAATASKAPIPDLSSTRIEALMERIKSLEQDKRRSQRLLLLTRKSIRGPLTVRGRVRLTRKDLPFAWTKAGPKRSGASKATARRKAAAPSTPTRAGEAAS